MIDTVDGEAEQNVAIRLRHIEPEHDDVCPRDRVDLEPTIDARDPHAASPGLHLQK